MMKKIFKGLVFALVFFVANFALAQQPEITDWYIKNFETEIVVNKDSSLMVTEKITADCGNLPDKHGIFRVLPLQNKTDKGVIKTPVELVSITDFEGNAYKYQAIKNRDTVTWKIGDPNKTVTGINNYKIVYRVKNTVRFFDSNSDELYWNLTGNFWDISINKFSGKIIFPEGISQQNAIVDYYTGDFGSKSKNLAAYGWDGDNLIFNSTGKLLPGQGITVSVSFSKGIIDPYQPGFMEKYGDYFFYLLFLIPLAVFIFAFRLWQEHGKDPKMKNSIPPEFGIPDNITPMQMGMVLYSGRWKDGLITATIIDLAVKNVITIEEIKRKALLSEHKDTRLTKNFDPENLTETEKLLVDKMFSGKTSVLLSELKNKFYKKIPDIRDFAKIDAESQGWIVGRGVKYGNYFFVAGMALFFISFSGLAIQILPLFFSLLFSGIIFFCFAIIMPKRTQKGADLLFKVKGFELYMRKAEDYRQQFYEKENIFDKFLPYAIVFGIAELWAKKMQLVYGEDYYQNYHPAWIVMASNSVFDAKSFTNQLNSITAGISSATSSASGSGGSGGAGGGGGGGGGGGW